MKTITTFLLFVLSFFLTVILCEYKGDQWEEIIRKLYYKVLTNESIPSYHKTYIDKKGIPFIHYFEINSIKTGKQYNPTIVSVFAIHYYHKFKDTSDPLYRDKFFHCIRWLEKNIIYKENFALFEPDWLQPFYPTVQRPWRSGLSSGLAIEAFTKAYKIKPEKKYLDISEDILMGFYHTVDNGSFTYRDSVGWWYEEYACSNAKTPRILNGHIFAMLGVWKFWFLTKNDSAYFIFRKGIESVKNNLWKYDADDGWSYYDSFRKKADKKYQKIHVNLMKKLWDITDDPLFYQFYKKWKTPLDKPYLVRIITEKNRSGMILFVLLNFMMITLIYAVKKILARIRIRPK